MKELVELILIIAWVFGIVIAKGFWSTLLAVILPIYAYVIVIMELIL
jgi:hypothetical protein